MVPTPRGPFNEILILTGFYEANRTFSAFRGVTAIQENNKTMYGYDFWAEEESSGRQNTFMRRSDAVNVQSHR